MNFIKFRGKNNGQWLYGTSLIQGPEGKDCKISTNGEDWQFVGCNTICQYIGKTDKNGKEIYENDIFTINGNSPKIVKFIDDNACFAVANINEYIDDTQYEENIWQQPSPNWWNKFKDSIEIIGDTFDRRTLQNFENNVHSD